MRRALFALSLLAVASLAGFASSRAAAPQPSTRIEADDRAGVIRFIVKGREQARLDDAGLHVREGVGYGGSMTDTGTTPYIGDAPARAAR